MLLARIVVASCVEFERT